LKKDSVIKIKPVHLDAGDTIGILSPAGPLYGEKLILFERGLDYLRKRGFKVIEGRSVRKINGYLAGTDEERADDFNRMFKNPEVSAIICSRGGYGCSRILSLIDYSLCRSNPKIFVGYSDITLLQMALYKNSDLVTFAGPMVAMDLGKGLDNVTEHWFWQQITQGDFHSFVVNEIDTAPIIYTDGVAEGPLLGGCLSAINSLIGTPYLPDMTGCILVLEDIGEDIYKIDRYFAQIAQAGIFQKVNGIVFGQFIDCGFNEDKKPTLALEQVIHHYIKDLHIPVIADFPYGHGERKVTLPIGCSVRLDTRKGELKMLEKGLR
jgi:muramoyltetrapeptide carboxypeptidase